MSADNFNFIANSGKTYPNLSASNWWGVPLTERLLTYFGKTPQPIAEDDWTEYGDQAEDEPSWIVDALLDRIETLEKGLQVYAKKDYWDPKRHLGMGNHGRAVDTVEWRAAESALKDKGDLADY